MKNTMTKNITIRDIIYSRIDFIENNKEYKKPKRGSGKEKANDVPSWARGEKPYKNENGKQFADRLLDEKYGKGNYSKGPGSEYNQIRKWGDRGFE